MAIARVEAGFARRRGAPAAIALPPMPGCLVTPAVLSLLMSMLMPLESAMAGTADPACGRLQMVRCGVDIVSASDGTTGVAKPSMAICAGDRIETGDRARARWIMPNGVSLEIGPRSQAQLDSPTRLRLDRGEALVLRPMGGIPLSAFEIAGPGGSAWIEGAKASIAFGSPTAKFRAVSFKGNATIALEDGRRLGLGEGQAFETGTDGAKPRALGKKELRALDLSLHETLPQKNPAPAFSCAPASDPN
jgi:hypothetical protein